jgi:hypothetical protein
MRFQKGIALFTNTPKETCSMDIQTKLLGYLWSVEFDYQVPTGHWHTDNLHVIAGEDGADAAEAVRGFLTRPDAVKDEEGQPTTCMDFRLRGLQLVGDVDLVAPEVSLAVGPDNP